MNNGILPTSLCFSVEHPAQNEQEIILRAHLTLTGNMGKSVPFGNGSPNKNSLKCLMMLLLISRDMYNLYDVILTFMPTKGCGLF